MRLNKATVTNAKAEGKTTFYWDEEISGFGLVVQPTGSKSYCYQYRTAEGRTRRGLLGKPSETFTPTRAREKAKAWRRIIEDGGDPLATKREAREALTMADLFDKYLESPRFAEKAASTRAIDRGRIHRHLVPTLGREFVHKMTTDTARRAFAKIRDGKTATNEKTGNRGRAIVKGGEGTARAAIRLLRAVFTWAMDEGYATSNPAAGVKVGTDGERDTILSSAEEYRRLFRTLDDLEERHEIRQPVADAIRVIALTGARRGEIASMRWSDVNLEEQQIVLPASRHKTGGKTGKPRLIGLPAAAQAIIARQPGGEPDDYVFRPARGTGGALNISKAWREKIRDAAGLPEGIGLHGLRHSLASSMAMAGAQAAEIMVTLGHRQLSTSQRYVHAAQDARAALAERAAATVTAALADADPADVVKIR